MELRIRRACKPVAWRGGERKKEGRERKNRSVRYIFKTSIKEKE
jgi:hypothetical protein